ncbi:hypothetical protein [Crateriforma spongiae]|uniref:hypothetical protein n=1 Tax=Crateriforma spongiae TaxID=2724528 RepID=UPI0014462817|nr:hypothetical protein [Crateriforma spongiae]
MLNEKRCENSQSLQRWFQLRSCRTDFQLVSLSAWHGTAFLETDQVTQRKRHFLGIIEPVESRSIRKRKIEKSRLALGRELPQSPSFTEQ